MSFLPPGGEFPPSPDHDGRVRDGDDEDARSVIHELATLTQRAVELRRSGRFAASVDQVRACHRLLEGVDADEVRSMEAALVDLRREWAISLSLAGDDIAGLRAWERVWDTAQATGREVESVLAAATVAYIHAVHGDRRYAGLWVGRADAIADHPLATAARAMLAIDCLDLDEAQRLADAAQPLDGTEAWAVLVWLDARIASLTGSTRAAMTRLRATCLAHYPKQWESGLNWYVIALATHRLTREDRGATTLRLDVGRAGEIAVETNHVDAALAAVEKGDPVAARAVTGPLLNDPDLSIRARVLIELLHASVAEDAAEAEVLVEAALETISREQIYTALLDVPVAGFEPAIVRRAGTDDRLARLLPRILGEASDELPALTRRERTVWWYLAEGLNLNQIAAAEFLSPNTVKTHVRSLYRKLDVNTRAAAVELARTHPNGPLPPTS